MALADKITKEIQQGIDKDIKMLILGQDLDSLVCAFIIYYLMKKEKINYSRASIMIKERRLKMKLDSL